MVNIKKWAVLVAIVVCSLFSLISSQSVIAAPDEDLLATPTVSCTERFLGFPAWYRGLLDDSCNVVTPASAGLSNFIWHIVMNVIEAAMMLVGYIAVGFILMGGFKLLTSQGESKAIADARTTITNAVLGLIISIIAVSAVNFIFDRLFNSNIAASGMVELSADTILYNALNTAYFIAGIIAVIVIVFAGYSYAMSAGDSAKITKAKNTILYAVVGIVVILLAFAITWFVIGRFQ